MTTPPATTPASPLFGWEAKKQAPRREPIGASMDANVNQSTPYRSKVNKITYRAVSDGYIRRWVPVLSPAQNAVMLALMTYLKRPKGQLGFVWPRLGTLGEAAGIKRRQTVGEAIDALADHGLIDKIDWPLNTYVGTKRDQRRILGGGDRRGKNLIFRLLHVDDDGVLHADPVRASADQLAEHEQSRREGIGQVMRLWFADEPDYVIHKAIVSRWPSLDDRIQAPDRSDGGAYTALSFQSLTIFSIAGSSDQLTRRWPLEGKNAPISELVQQRPGRFSYARIGEMVMGGIDVDGISARINEIWPSVPHELKALDAFGERRLGLDNLNMWRASAPLLGKVCETYRIGPRRALEWGSPDDDEQDEFSNQHIVQEVA